MVKQHVDTILSLKRKDCIFFETSLRIQLNLIVTSEGRYLTISIQGTKTLISCRFSSSVALRIVYGFGAMNNDDPHILLAEEMMRVSENAIIGGWAVDFFPWRMFRLST